MKKIFIGIGLLFATFLHSEIKTIHKINEIEKELSEKLTSDDLILFDIDYTLTMPCHPALSKSSVKKNKDLYRQKLAELTDEQRQLIPLVFISHFPDMSILTEPCIPDLIASIRKQGATVLGFTASDTSVIPEIGDLPSWRFKELERLEIHFSKTFKRTEFFEFTPHRGTFPLHENGIIYSNVTNTKGSVLKAFIEKMQQKPRRIVFVDDLIENLISADHAMQELDIPFLGLHYTPNEQHDDVPKEFFEKIWQEILARAKNHLFPVGTIQTAHHAAIEWAIKNSSKDSLVIFDIGNVILAPNDAVLHLNHRKWLKDWLEKENIPFDCFNWNKLAKIVDLEAEAHIVNSSLPKIINEAKLKTKIMALSRYWIGPTINGKTFEEHRQTSLRKVKIDFEEPFPSAAGWHDHTHQSTYANGILLTEAPLKGPVFTAFLNQINWLPKSIVFIDDRKEQCESMTEAALSLNIPILCIHYTEAIENAPLLDPAIANVQLRTLINEYRWINDEQARESKPDLP